MNEWKRRMIFPIWVANKPEWKDKVGSSIDELLRIEEWMSLAGRLLPSTGVESKLRCCAGALWHGCCPGCWLRHASQIASVVPVHGWASYKPSPVIHHDKKKETKKKKRKKKEEKRGKERKERKLSTKCTRPILPSSRIVTCNWHWVTYGWYIQAILAKNNT